MPNLNPDDQTSYGSEVAFIFIFNIIVGTGSLTLPSAFLDAGWLISSMVVSLICMTSFISLTFIIESMSIANYVCKTNTCLFKDTALEESESESERSLSSRASSNSQSIESTPLINSTDMNDLTSEQSIKDDSHLFDLDQKMELGHMARLFFKKEHLKYFYFCIIIYLYGDLTIYSTAISKSLRDVSCTYDNCNKTVLDSNDLCFENMSYTRGQVYRFYILIIGLILPFFNLHTKYLQFLTTLFRLCAFTSMITLASITLIQGRGEGNPPKSNLFGISNLFGVCVYSFMCHHSIPRLITPLKNKRHLYRLLTLDYFLVLLFYLALSLTGIFVFKFVEDVYTLNFQKPRCAPINSTIFDESNVPQFRILELFLPLFPVFTLSTNFPILAVTLSNNLKALLLKENLSDSSNNLNLIESISTRIFFPLIVFTPPILISYCSENVELLVGITGSYGGMAIQYLIPLFLVYNARNHLNKIENNQEQLSLRSNENLDNSFISASTSTVPRRQLNKKLFVQNFQSFFTEYLRDSIYWVFMGKARRKEKDVTSDDKAYLQEEFLQCLAVEMELAELVNLPNGIVQQEWIASNTIAFFEHINLIYGTISEFCTTMSGCSEMCGPGNKLYLWIDERGKRSKVPAPQYIDYVMTYMQKTLNDESIFPTKQDKDFPSSFDVYARKIYRLLFHVLAHIYHMHFNEIVILDLHKHLNCIFAHLVLFNQQFNLIESKELDALNDLSIALKLIPDNQTIQESMQTLTPEPPSLPTSLNLTDPIEQSSIYLDKDLQSSCELNTNQMETSSSINNSNQQQSQENSRKKHSRQHSYTTTQISSPTNYIKRFFISSFSQQNNQTTIANSSSNQNCAINEDNLIENNQTQQQSSNVITTQCKSISPFSVRNTDYLDQSDLLNSDQENQHDSNKNTMDNNQKIVLNNLLKQTNSQDADTSSINLSSSNPTKTHKYQHSTPIFFFSGSFFSNRTTKNDQFSTNDNRADENNVQSNNKIIKENTKLLNSDQTDDHSSDYSRRTTSASAIDVYLTSQQMNNTAPSIFSTTGNNLMMPNLNEENLTDDYSLDDQTTKMSCNQSQLNDSNSDLQMDTSSTVDESTGLTFASNRTFGNLEMNNEFENADKTSSNQHNNCKLIDST